jgi:hypothetical protein
MKAKAVALKHEHNNRAWLAYHIAVLSRSKKIPNLQRLMAKESGRRQNWQEQMMIMEKFASDQRKARAMLAALEGKGNGR